MQRLLVLLLCLCFSVYAHCKQRTYIYNKVSGKFNFVCRVNYKDSPETMDIISDVWLDVKLKSGELVQTLHIVPEDMTTEFNNPRMDKIGGDGFYGDVVVTDFNFDGVEDVAIKYALPMGYGQLYAFFVQDSRGKFKELSAFNLADPYRHGGVYPSNIDKKEKTVSFVYWLNANETETIVMKYNKQNKRWTKKSSIYRGLENGKEYKRIKYY